MFLDPFQEDFVHTPMFHQPMMPRHDDFFHEFFHRPEPIASEGLKTETPKTETPEDPTMKTKKYTYHHHATVDEKGNKVETMRKHYEDSNGKTKTWEERKIGDKSFRQVWDKPSKDAEMIQHHSCSGTPEEFETLWADTPFAKSNKALTDA